MWILKADLVELQVHELHLSLLFLFQKLVHLVTSAVEEWVAYPEIAEYRLVSCLYTDLGVSIYCVVLIIHHPSVVVFLSRFILHQGVALVRTYSHKKTSFVKWLFLLQDSRIETCYKSTLGPYNKTKVLDVINIEMKIDFISCVIFIEEGCSDDFRLEIGFNVLDKYIFIVLVPIENILVEECSGVGYHDGRLVVPWFIFLFFLLKPFVLCFLHNMMLLLCLKSLWLLFLVC